MQGNEWQHRSTNDRAVFTQNRCTEIDEEPFFPALPIGPEKRRRVELERTGLGVVNAW